MLIAVDLYDYIHACISDLGIFGSQVRAFLFFVKVYRRKYLHIISILYFRIYIYVHMNIYVIMWF